jgi:hypothetical protein
MHLKESDPRLQALIAAGYYIYCPVESKMNLTYGKNYMMQGRLNVDGFTFLKYPERMRSLFKDPKKLIDKSRNLHKKPKPAQTIETRKIYNERRRETVKPYLSKLANGNNYD